MSNKYRLTYIIYIGDKGIKRKGVVTFCIIQKKLSLKAFVYIIITTKQKQKQYFLYEKF